MANGSLAAIAKVRDLGTCPQTSGTTSVVGTITVVAAGAAAGHLVVVSVVTAGDPSMTQAIAVTDSASNTYTLDANVPVWAGLGNNRRTYILSSVLANPIPGSGTITVTMTGGTPNNGVNVCAVATEFSGVLAMGRLDKTATGIGQSNMPVTAATATTTQAAELLYGAVGTDDQAGFAAGAGYTALPSSGSTPYLNPEFRIVNATGAYTAGATVTNSTNWGVAIATYKDACAADTTVPAVTPPPTLTTTQTLCM